MHEDRAVVLSEVLRAVAAVPGPCKAMTIAETVLTVVGRPEEECGPDILAAIALLVRCGVVDCLTATADRTEISIGAETEIIPSHALITFMWADAQGGEDD